MVINRKISLNKKRKQRRTTGPLKIKAKLHLTCSFPSVVIRNLYLASFLVLLFPAWLRILVGPGVTTGVWGIFPRSFLGESGWVFGMMHQILSDKARSWRRDFHPCPQPWKSIANVSFCSNYGHRWLFLLVNQTCEVSCSSSSPYCQGS